MNYFSEYFSSNDSTVNFHYVGAGVVYFIVAVSFIFYAFVLRHDIGSNLTRLAGILLGVSGGGAIASAVRGAKPPPKDSGEGV